MPPFTTLEARACPLPRANLDTDQLIPARFMSRPRAAGYGDFLLHGHRFDTAGAPRADCPLNDPRYAGAQVLVALRNFGSGSSREAAVYALMDHGFRCVIAPSFGDIFAANAVNNGLLPAVIGEEEALRLIACLEQGGATLTLDLAQQTIRTAGLCLGFSIDPVWRMKLLKGWDDLDLTLSHQAQIESFFALATAARPWILPGRGGAEEN